MVTLRGKYLRVVRVQVEGEGVLVRALLPISVLHQPRIHGEWHQAHAVREDLVLQRTAVVRHPHVLHGNARQLGDEDAPERVGDAHVNAHEVEGHLLAAELLDVDAAARAEALEEALRVRVFTRAHQLRQLLVVRYAVVLKVAHHCYCGCGCYCYCCGCVCGSAGGFLVYDAGEARGSKDFLNGVWTSRGALSLYGGGDASGGSVGRLGPV